MFDSLSETIGHILLIPGLTEKNQRENDYIYLSLNELSDTFTV